MIILLLIPLALLFLLLAWFCFRGGHHRHMLVLSLFAILFLGAAGLMIGFTWYIWQKI